MIRRTPSCSQKAAIVRRHLAERGEIDRLANEQNLDASDIRQWARRVLDSAEQTPNEKKTGNNNSVYGDAAKIQALRVKNDLTVAKLAKCSDISHVHFKRILSGTRCKPTTLMSIANVLGVCWGNIVRAKKVTLEFHLAAADMPSHCKSNDEVVDWLMTEPDSFMIWWADFYSLHKRHPRILKVFRGSLKIHVEVSESDANKSIEAWRNSVFANDILNVRVVDSSATNSIRKRKRSSIIAFVCIALLVTAISALYFFPAAFDSQQIELYAAGRPTVKQIGDSYMPGERLARIPITIRNTSKEDVLVGNDCVLDVSPLGVKTKKISYYLEPGQSQIVRSGEEQAFMFLANNLNYDIRNTEYNEPVRPHECKKCAATITVRGLRKSKAAFPKSISLWVSRVEPKSKQNVTK